MTRATVQDLVKTARNIYCDGPFVRRTFQRLRCYICPFEELIDRVPVDSRLLDVGCGAGLFLALLASAGRLQSGLGCDVSQPALDQAARMRERLPEKVARQLSFVQFDPGNPLPDGLFDVVSMIDVMHHIPSFDQHAALAQAIERVRPGGLFLYKDMARRPFWRAGANRLHDLLVSKEWIHYCPIESVERWAGENHAELIESASYYRYWYHHEMRVFRRRT